MIDNSRLMYRLQLLDSNNADEKIVISVEDYVKYRKFIDYDFRGEMFFAENGEETFDCELDDDDD